MRAARSCFRTVALIFRADEVSWHVFADTESCSLDACRIHIIELDERSRQSGCLALCRAVLSAAVPADADNHQRADKPNEQPAVRRRGEQFPEARVIGHANALGADGRRRTDE